MKKLLFMLMLITSLSVSATSKDTLNAVTMVSYEQGWIDTKGTLALKNNTNEDIHNITYRITYLDMKGRALDYKDLTSDIEIAPGLTKKVNINAYEHDRGYSYYLSEAAYSNPQRFKIKFELIGYNTPDEPTYEHASATSSYLTETDSNLHGSCATSEFAIIIALIIGIFVLGIYVGMYVLVAVMANKRHRNAALWVLVSLFATPLLTIIILLCIGEDN